MSWIRGLFRWMWRHFLPHARITVRIVTAVVLAMSVVLLAAGAFVFWRISYALDRQLDQDLRAYTATITRAVTAGAPLPADNPGEVSQTYSTTGALLAKSDQGVRRLLAPNIVAAATRSMQTTNLERLLPPPQQNPYRVSYQEVTTPRGAVVLATGISRRKHDEALRELLAQLALADIATVAAAAVVGWGATRAALGPVERYRRAAAAAGGDPRARLPVETGRDDELTRLGTTFNTLLEEVEASHRRERQFLADASHELRSPLALVAAEVEWARHRPRSPQELDQVLVSVGDQTARLARLSDALLDLEEATDGSRIHRRRVRLEDLVASAVDAFHEDADRLGRRIVLDVPVAEVTVEPRWFELALGNLVANALKHGRGTVSVTAHRTAETVQLDVRDEGGGVPAELGETAFERFARADNSRTTPGHGLGLAIVAAVASRHDGRAYLIDNGVRIELQDAIEPAANLNIG